MITVAIIAFIAGIVAHKLWRALWRTWQQPVTFRHAIATEFAPPDPDKERRRRRTPHITEQV